MSFSPPNTLSRVHVGACAASLLVALAVGLGTAADVAAQDRFDTPLRETLPPVTPRDASTSPGTFEPPRVLVMIGGTMVEGLVTESASGYLVELPRGRYVVPYDRVLLAARDRVDAYEKQRRNMRPRTPVNHFKLAKWCLRYQMMPQAKAELRSALSLAGNYGPARDLLKDIEQLERPIAPRHQRPEDAAAKTDDGYEPRETVSVSGLSADTTTMFTNRVQPLLVNSCANAKCHGRDASDFQIEYVRFGRSGIRAATQRNLAAVLHHVDLEQPHASAVLTAPSGVHGGGRRPVFQGRAGRKQIELMKEWLELVAQDLGPEDSKRNRDSEVRPAVARRWDPRPRPPVVRPVSGERESAPKRRKPDLLDRILDEERPDAFDPAAFNRANTSPPAAPRR